MENCLRVGVSKRPYTKGTVSVLIACPKGADGIKVWDMKTYGELAIPQQPFHARAQVSCTAWITRRNEAFDTICYGNALGWLVFLQHRPNEVSSATLGMAGADPRDRGALRPFILRV
jgi:phage terminase large subunit GpA-like protein